MMHRGLFWFYPALETTERTEHAVRPDQMLNAVNFQQLYFMLFYQGYRHEAGVRSDVAQ